MYIASKKFVIATFLVLSSVYAHAIDFEKDYYAILEVSPRATQKEIKTSYRRLAMKYHPDRLEGLSPETYAEGELKFKTLSDAYDILYDEKSRQQYDSNRHISEAEAGEPIVDLQKALRSLSQAQSTEQIVEGLKNLNRYRNFIYTGGDYIEYSDAAYLTLEAFNEMIAKDLFTDPVIAKEFLTLTGTWTFQEDQTVYQKSIDWTDLHAQLFERLARNGYDHTKILSILKSVSVSAHIDVDMRVFGGELHYVDRTVPMGKMESSGTRSILVGMLETNKIKSAAELFSVIETLKASTDSDTNPLRNAFEGNLHRILPMIKDMTAEQIVDIAYATNGRALEILAILQTTLDLQKQTYKFTAQELTQIISRTIDASRWKDFPLDTYVTTDKDVALYMATHRGIAPDDLEKWVDTKNKEYKKENRHDTGYFAIKRVHSFMRKDYVELLKRYKSVLKKTGLVSEDIGKIRASFKWGMFFDFVRFGVRWLPPRIPFTRKINWVSELNKSATKTQTAHPVCSRILLP